MGSFSEYYDKNHRVYDEEEREKLFQESRKKYGEINSADIQIERPHVDTTEEARRENRPIARTAANQRTRERSIELYNAEVERYNAMSDVEKLTYQRQQKQNELDSLTQNKTTFWDAVFKKPDESTGKQNTLKEWKADKVKIDDLNDEINAIDATKQQYEQAQKQKELEGISTRQLESRLYQAEQKRNSLQSSKSETINMDNRGSSVAKNKEKAANDVEMTNVENEIKLYQAELQRRQDNAMLEGLNSEAKEALVGLNSSRVATANGIGNYATPEEAFRDILQNGGQGAALDVNAKKYKQQLLDMGFTDQAIEDLTAAQKRESDRLANEAITQKSKEFGEGHPVAATVASPILSSAATIGTLGELSYSAAYGTPYSASSQSNWAYNAKSAATQGVTENFDNGVLSRNTKIMLYQTGTSALDSLTMGASPVGEALLGMNAFSQTLNDNVNSGKDFEGALAGAALAGIAEGTFEHLSIGNLKAFDEVSEASVKAVIGNIGKSAVVNFSEEANTEIANIISDYLINGGMSDIQQNIAAYVNQGYTVEEAQKKAYADAAKQIGEAGLSGAIMGAGFGVGGSAYQAAGTAAYNTAVGGAILDEGKAAEVIVGGQQLTDKRGKKTAEKVQNDQSAFIEQWAADVAERQAVEEENEIENTAAEDNGDDYAFSLKSSEGGTKYVEVDTDQEQFDGLTRQEQTKRAKKIIQDNFVGRVVGTTNRAYVNSDTASEYAHPRKKLDDKTHETKMRASTELDNLLDAGTNFRTTADGKDGHVHEKATGDFQYYDTVFKVGDEYYSGTVNIMPVKKGLLLKDVTNIKNITEGSNGSIGESQSPLFLSDVSDDSIKHSLKFVNSSVAKKATNSENSAKKGENSQNNGNYSVAARYRLGKLAGMVDAQHSADVKAAQTAAIQNRLVERGESESNAKSLAGDIYEFVAGEEDEGGRLKQYIKQNRIVQSISESEAAQQVMRELSGFANEGDNASWVQSELANELAEIERKYTDTSVLKKGANISATEQNSGIAEQTTAKTEQSAAKATKKAGIAAHIETKLSNFENAMAEQLFERTGGQDAEAFGKSFDLLYTGGLTGYDYETAAENVALGSGISTATAKEIYKLGQEKRAKTKAAESTKADYGKVRLSAINGVKRSSDGSLEFTLTDTDGARLKISSEMQAKEQNIDETDYRVYSAAAQLMDDVLIQKAVSVYNADNMISTAPANVATVAAYAALGDDFVSTQVSNVGFADAVDAIGSANAQEIFAYIQSKPKSEVRAQTKKGSGQFTDNIDESKLEGNQAFDYEQLKKSGMLDLYSAVAAATGFNIVLEPGNGKANGRFNPNTGTVTIFLGAQNAFTPIVHEIGHAIAVYDKEGYSQIKDAIVAFNLANGTNEAELNAMLADMMQQWGIFDRTSIEEEFVNEQLAGLFSDAESAGNFIEWLQSTGDFTVNEKKTIAQKMANAIKRVIAKFKEIIDNITKGSFSTDAAREAAALARVDAVGAQEIRAMFLDSIDKMNGRPTQLVTIDQVRSAAKSAVLAENPGVDAAALDAALEGQSSAYDADISSFGEAYAEAAQAAYETVVENDGLIIRNINGVEVFKSTDLPFSMKGEEKPFETDKYFERQIDNIENLKHGSYVKVGVLSANSPIVQVGMAEGVVRYDVSKILKNLDDHSDYLNKNHLKLIPRILSDPVAITEYSQPNTVNVFGFDTIKNKPVMVGITLSTDRAGNIIDKIRTFNIRRDGEKLINDSTILYLNENKRETKAWFQACGNPVPLGGNTFGFVRSISENENSVKFSLKSPVDIKKSFAQQIDDYKSGKFPANDTLIVRDTPKVFQNIGLTAVPMTYTQNHLKLALANRDGDHLGEALLKKLPQALENPIAIIDSATKPGRLVAIVEMPGQTRSTIAAVEVEGTGRLNNETIDSNAIVSVHSRNNAFSRLLKTAIQSESAGNGGIYYWQKNKAVNALIATGVQFPGVTGITDGYVRSINDTKSKVNSSIKKSTDGETYVEVDRKRAEDEGKYSYDSLIKKSNMKVALIDDTKQYIPSKRTRKDIVTSGMENAAAFGIVNEVGQTFVHVNDINSDVLVGKNGLQHGLDRRLSLNAPIVENVGEILSNAIKLNELNPRKNVSEAYLLLGIAQNKSGDNYIVSFAVNKYTNQVESIDVLYSLNAKQNGSSRVLPPSAQGAKAPASSTTSEISIADFLELVKENFPDALSMDVLEHFEIEQRTDGAFSNSVKYSQKSADSNLFDDAKKERRYQNLLRVNKEMREELEKIDWMTFAAARHLTADFREVRKLSSKLKKEYKTGAELMEIEKKLTILYAEMNKGNRQKADELADDAAEYILSNSREYGDDIDDFSKEVLSYVKRFRWRMTKEEKAEVRSSHDSVKGFMDRYRGNITFTNDSAATALDSLWKEWAEAYPSVFRQPEIGSLSPYNFTEVIDMYSQKHRVEYYDEVKEELKAQLKMDALEVATLESADLASVALGSNIEKMRTQLQSEFQEKLDEFNREKEEYIEKAKAEIAKAEQSQKLTEKERQRLIEQQAKLQQRQDAKDETEDKRKRRTRIEKKVKMLNRMLLKPNAQGFVTEDLRKSTANLLKVFSNDSSVFDYKQLDRVRKAYQKIGGDESEISGAFDEDILNTIDSLKDTIDGKRLSKLDAHQLHQIETLLDHFSAIVKDEAEVFLDGKRQQLAGVGDNIIAQMDNVKKTKKPGLMDSRLMVNNLTPVYFFERIGGELEKGFKDINDAKTKYTKAVAAAKNVLDETKEQYGAGKKWNFNDKHEFTTERGDKLVFTTSQLMQIYATAKREQLSGKETRHLMQGGITFEDDVDTNSYRKSGKVGLKNDKHGHPLTIDDIGRIGQILTKGQKGFVNDIVSYLSYDMSQLGNETSMELYGYKKFNESYYFPIHSSGRFLFQRFGEAGEKRLKTSGFTKEVTYKAGNPIVLSGFIEVAAEHMERMAAYNAFTVPMENLQKMWNYNQKGSGKSVKSAIEDAYGKDYNEYITTLMSDINGGMSADPRENLSGKAISKYKKLAVLANASVVVQQPTAIIRAMALVNPKYFLPALRPLKSFAEARQYSSAAMLKEIGGFDTGNGKGIVNWMLDGSNSSGKASEKLNDAVDKIGGFGPEKADALAWGTLWEAVKREVAAKTGSSGEALLQAAGKRFDEICDKTQVYDTTLTKSANMRSKSGLMKMLTAFGAEPTLTLNMMLNAVDQAKKGNVRYAAAAGAAVIMTTIANSIIKSLVTAARHRGEDETFLESYIEEVINNFSEDINPLSMIPFVKDVISIISGYDVGRSDMETISKVINDVSNLSSTGRDIVENWNNRSAEENAWELAKETGNAVLLVAYAMGIPAENVNRDVWAAVNAFTLGKDAEGEAFQTTPSTAADAAAAGAFPLTKSLLHTLDLLDDKKKSEKLLEALQEGDDEKLRRIRSSYKDEKSFKSNGVLAAVRNGYKSGKLTAAEANKLLSENGFADASKRIDSWNKQISEAQNEDE